MEQLFQLITDPLGYIESVFYISPFWYYAIVIGFPTTIAAGAIGLFFPPARSLMGVILVSGGTWLWGYWRGSADTGAHDKAEAERKKPKPQSWEPWF